MHWRRWRLGIILGTALLLLVIALGTGLLLERMRQAAMQTAEITVEQTARLIESTFNRHFLTVDGALASLPALLSSARPGDGGIDPAAASRLLQGLNFQTLAFRDIVLLRPDGTRWASARAASQRRPLPIQLQNLVADSRPGAAMVGGPARNPVTGDWSLYLARSITLPGPGRLEAVAEVPLSLIGNRFGVVEQTPGLRISLERQNGQLLASQPHDELRIGEKVNLAASAPRMDGVAFTVSHEGLPAPAIGAVRPTLYSDILIAVTLDQATALAEWERDRNRLLVAVTVAALLIVAMASAFYAALAQRERTEIERARARDMLANSIESMSDGFVMWDSEDRLVTCNRYYRDLYEISAPLLQPGALFEDIIREGALLGQYPQASGDLEAFVRETIEWHRGGHGSMERLLPDGRWLLITERRTADGGIVGIRTDITALKQALADLAKANEVAQKAVAEAQKQNAALMERDRALHTQNVLFDAALNNMSQGLIMVDAQQRIIVSNARFRALFGLGPETAEPGTSVAELFHHLGALQGREAMEKLWKQMSAFAGAHRSGSIITTIDDGRALAVSQRPMSDGGWVATFEDVTERQQAEARIRFMAHHDALTELPNRVLFHERLNEALRNLDRHGPDLALLCLDLDKFKDVNDTLGHPVGDALLKAASRRLQNCLREGDLVARLGGDEFAVLQLSGEMPGAAENLGRRIIAALSAPYELAGRNVVVGASVGIAIASEADVNADTLFQNADLALYEAKAQGRGTCCLFQSEMDAELRARMAIEVDLRGAFEKGQFEIAYQPLFDLCADRIVGFEALLRWNHPVRGLVPPSVFIPMAEELGLIGTIGTWVLQQACADVAAIPGNVKVAVNLSPLQLKTDDIIQTVADALQRSGLRPERLELEITESALLQNNARTVALLHQLRNLGLRIALDDFGTGYSSLSYLRSFPFNKIKIDQSFVKEMIERPDSQAIVNFIAQLAGRLNMTTTAEGVETLDQLYLVRNAGCAEAQGHLFGTAKPISEAALFLKQGQSKHHSGVFHEGL